MIHSRCNLENVKEEKMTVDELPISAYFQLEDYDWNDVRDLPGVDEDYMSDWETIVFSVAEERFRDACRNLWPLIADRHFRSVTIGIDLLDMGADMAGYYHHYSNEGEGNYGFSVSYKVLKDYLEAHFDALKELTPHTRHLWEHELIHLCDHRFISEFKYHNRSTDIREFLIHYLLSFRNEGIADLFITMLGFNSVKDPETARQKFLEGISNFEKVKWEDEEQTERKKFELISTYDFYALGPWMVLHSLSCLGNRNQKKFAKSVTEKMQAGNKVSMEDMLKIIGNAVEISNADFINSLAEDGIDNIPFIQRKVLDGCAARIAKVRHKWIISDEDEEYRKVNAALTGFFESQFGKVTVSEKATKYNPAFRFVRLGPSEGKRFQRVGEIGEILAERILRENGFSDIKNLNKTCKNFVFADFFAKKDGSEYLISVKARNKFENNGSLNSRYKLGKNLENRINRALSIEAFRDCKPAWMVIVLESDYYSAYFGLIEELDSIRAIKMTQKAIASYRCFGKDVVHGFNEEDFKNVYHNNDTNNVKI